MRPARIALISSSFDPYPGGVEEHSRQIAVHLKRFGLPVEVWTVDRGEHLGVRQVDGVTVRYLATPLPNASAEGVKSFMRDAPGAWRAWSDAVANFKPDVLHVQCFGPNGVYALALALRFRLPLVVSSHGETMADDHGAFDTSVVLRTTLRWSLAHAVRVTAPSQLVLDDLRARFGLRTPGDVVPNGVEPSFAKRNAATPRTLPIAEGPTVFAVGRVEWVKGFDLLVRALPLVEPRTTRLVIVGAGGQLDDLRALAIDLGVDDRVLLTGALPRTSVIASLPEADVVAVPSRKESFGIVVLEAWQAGVPLVATMHGGPGTLVTDGSDGLLADPENAQSFAAAISRVLGDPSLAHHLVEGGRRSVRHFSWTRATQRYGPSTPRSFNVGRCEC